MRYIKQKEKMATLDKQKILSDQEQAENDNQLALGYSSAIEFKLKLLDTWKMSEQKKKNLS